MIKSNCWSFKLPFVCWRSLPLGISLFAYLSTVGRVKAIEGQTRPVKFKCTAFHLCWTVQDITNYLCADLFYISWPDDGRVKLFLLSVFSRGIAHSSIHSNTSVSVQHGSEWIILSRPIQVKLTDCGSILICKQVAVFGKDARPYVHFTKHRKPLLALD